MAERGIVRNDAGKIIDCGSGPHGDFLPCKHCGLLACDGWCPQALEGLDKAAAREEMNARLNAISELARKGIPYTLTDSPLRRILESIERKCNG